MMMSNDVRDLKKRHLERFAEMKAFQKSMDEEREIIDAVIEMNTTLSRNFTVTKILAFLNFISMNSSYDSIRIIR